MVLPLAFITLILFLNDDSNVLSKTVVITVATSIIAFFICQALIESFKDMLRDKGLFGRDLNKAGIQKYKQPV